MQALSGALLGLGMHGRSRYPAKRGSVKKLSNADQERAAVVRSFRMKMIAVSYTQRGSSSHAETKKKQEDETESMQCHRKSHFSTILVLRTFVQTHDPD
jgi:hypothetical protein